MFIHSESLDVLGEVLAVQKRAEKTSDCGSLGLTQNNALVERWFRQRAIVLGSLRDAAER